MSDPVERFLADWHRGVAQRDVAALAHLLADDVSLGAPPYWARFEGRELVEQLLGLILTTIEGFAYHRQWREGAELALEFTGRVGEIDLQGIDLVSLDAGGRLVRLDVLMRPVNAVEALIGEIRPKMTAFFAQRSAANTPRS